MTTTSDPTAQRSPHNHARNNSPALVRALCTLLALGATKATPSLAQDFEPAPAAEAPPAAPPVDAGVEAAQTLLPEPRDSGQSRASELVRVSEAKLSERYAADLAERRLIVAVGEASATIRSDQILMVRDALIQEAELMARAGIIESVRSTFSARRQYALGVRSINRNFLSERARLEKQLNETMVELDTLLAEEKNERLAAARNELGQLEPSSLGTLAQAVFDKILRALELEIEVKNREANLEEEAERQRYLKARAERIAALQSQIEATRETQRGIEKKLEEIDSKPKTKVANNATLLAELPLLGAVTVDSAETYRDGVYEVAVLQVWSDKLESAALAVFTEDQPMTVGDSPERLSQQLSALDPRFAFGSRHFVDASGYPIFVGIGATPLPRSGPGRTVAIESSKLKARQSLAFSVFGSVVARTEAEEIMGRMGEADGEIDSIETFQSFRKTIADETDTMELAFTRVASGREVSHPLSGEKIFVTVMVLDPTGSARARQWLARAYAARNEVLTAGVRNQAFQDEMERRTPGDAAGGAQEGAARAQAMLEEQQRIADEGNLPQTARPGAAAASVAPAEPKGRDGGGTGGLFMDGL